MDGLDCRVLDEKMLPGSRCHLMDARGWRHSLSGQAGVRGGEGDALECDRFSGNYEAATAMTDHNGSCLAGSQTSQVSLPDIEDREVHAGNDDLGSLRQSTRASPFTGKLKLRTERSCH